jgi:hypothetical protein
VCVIRLGVYIKYISFNFILFFPLLSSFRASDLFFYVCVCVCVCEREREREREESIMCARVRVRASHALKDRGSFVFEILVRSATA